LEEIKKRDGMAPPGLWHCNNGKHSGDKSDHRSKDRLISCYCKLPMENKINKVCDG